MRNEKPRPFFHKPFFAAAQKFGKLGELCK